MKNFPVIIYLNISFILLNLINASKMSLTFERVKELCKNDKELCWQRSLDGLCFGNSLKSQVIMKKCKCSCEAALYTRIQNCCLTVGRPEMRFCLPLCGYNITAAKIGSDLGVKCVSELTTWAYCAADANDNTNCCVPDECLSFCKGNVPTCDLQSIFSYQSCLTKIDSIISCQVENLHPTPRFDPEWQAPCEWE